MRARVFLFLGLLFSLSNPAHAQLPKELQDLIFAHCGYTIRLFTSPTSFSPERSMLKLVESHHTRFEAFRARAKAFMVVILDYLSTELEKGRIPSAVINDIDLTLDQYMTETFTPEELSGSFRLAVSQMENLRRKALGPNKQFSLTDAGIAPKSRELKKLVREFESTGAKMFLIDAASALFIDTHRMTEDFFTIYPDLWREFLPAFGRGLGDGVVSQFYRQGFILSRPVIAPPLPKAEPGVYIVSDFNPPGLPDWVIHEMAHVVQDAKWDLDLLVSYYLSYAKPMLSKIPQGELHRVLIDRFPEKRFAFLSLTEYSQYRADVFSRGNLAGMRQADWVLFVDFLSALKELDSHLQSGLMADENKLPVNHLHPDRIFPHLEEVYFGEDKGILKLAARLLPSEAMIEVTRRLNTHPRQNP